MSATIEVRLVRCFAEQRQTIRAQMVKIKKELVEGRKGSGQKTMLYDILVNNQMRPQDKETERLVTEALSVVAAG